jgi:hypothetical protein
VKIEIPKVVIPVDLGGYAAELAGKQLYVWVNPSMSKLKEYEDLRTDLQQQELTAAQQVLMPEQKPAEKGAGVLKKTFEEVGRLLSLRKADKPQGVHVKMLAWYAEIWSQGPAEMHWTVAELQELEARDPAFLGWMISKTWQTRLAHVEHKKKS